MSDESGEGFVDREVLVRGNTCDEGFLGFKMKALWDGDQELGRRNASIMDGGAAFDDSSKFDDDGKLRRTGLNLSPSSIMYRLIVAHFSTSVS